MCQMTETANLDLFRLLYIGSSAAMIPKLNNYWREGAYQYNVGRFFSEATCVKITAESRQKNAAKKN